MAKFVAESQQVKQVLETNMLLLKDSLEKQGMNVQGFCVSVRLYSNQSDRNRAQSENSKSHKITGTAYRSTVIEGSLMESLESAGSNNPYTWGSSTINLTA
jgi:flagellar hook-length control protein FliK